MVTMKDDGERLLASLPFNGLKDNPKLPYWLKHAPIIAERLRSGPAALIAPPSAGKTAIAILVAIILRMRSTFMEPQKIIAHPINHPQFLDMITGGAYPWTWQTGETPAAKRTLDHRYQFTFTTADSSWKDVRAHQLQPTALGLPIMDEFQHALGSNVEAVFMRYLNEQGIPFLALSASTGRSDKSIAKLKETLGIQNFYFAYDIPVAEIEKVKIDIPLTINLAKLDELLVPLILETARELEGYGYTINVNQRPSHEQLEQIELELKKRELLSKQGYYVLTKDHYRAVEASARCRKLDYALRLAFSGYIPFLEYADELRCDPNHTKSSHWIARHPSFADAIGLANQRRHPKVGAVLERFACQRAKNMHLLCFVNDIKVGRHYAEAAQEVIPNLRITNLFAERARVKQLAALQESLRQGNFDLSIATSVAQEGISIEEVDEVIHGDLPLTMDDWVQRCARTGRKRSGCAAFPVLNHEYEQQRYLGLSRRASAEEAWTAGRVGWYESIDTTQLALSFSSLRQVPEVLPVVTVTSTAGTAASKPKHRRGCKRGNDEKQLAFFSDHPARLKFATTGNGFHGPDHCF